MKSFSLVLLVAGYGKRFSKNQKKQFIEIKGQPIYRYSLDTFSKLENINEIVIVHPPKEKNKIEKLNFISSKKIMFIEGGYERYHSVINGVKACADGNWVFIHDGARPLIHLEDILNMMELCREEKVGILPCAKVTDTIKYHLRDEKGNYWVKESINRNQLAAASTPQIFHVKTFLQVVNKFKNQFIPTDDAELFLSAGYQVKIYWLQHFNPKLTNPTDKTLIEYFL